MTPVVKQTSVSPTVAAIISTMRERLITGYYPSGTWLPSERDLATEFSVSRILIRAAITELEKSKLIICNAHHRPRVANISCAKRRTSKNRTKSLALWISPNPQWPGTVMVMKGIQEAAAGDWRVVLGSPVGETKADIKASEIRFLQQIYQDNDVEGLIISCMGGVESVPALKAIQSLNIPLVFIDHLPPKDIIGDYVGVNNKKSMEKAVRSLYMLGHKNIAYVSNYDEYSTVSDRVDGYKSALKHSGVNFRPELVEIDPGPSGEDQQEGCESLIERLLALPIPPTAIACVNDITAFRVISAIKKLGLRVPEDISVMGFDGVERWLPNPPFLTTSLQPFDRIGSHAMELLLERYEVESEFPSRHIILETTFQSNASTIAIPR